MTYLQRFREKFNKPISDEVHRLYNSPTKLGVYYDNTDLESFITQERQQLIQEAVECVPPKATERNMARLSADFALTTVEEVEIWNACREEMLKALTNLK